MDIFQRERCEIYWNLLLNFKYGRIKRKLKDLHKIKMDGENDFKTIGYGKNIF